MNLASRHALSPRDAFCYPPPVSHAQLEQTLRNLPAIGTLKEADAGREVWRFPYGQLEYDLVFYRREPSTIRRLLYGNRALRGFFYLQQLQKAGVPAVRALAVLQGFRLRERLGDALIVQAMPDALPLEEHLVRLELAGQPVPDHRALSEQVRSIMRGIGKLKLGHGQLSLNSFLLRDGKLYLRDPEHLRAGGLRTADVLRLGHAARHFATLTDLIRGWELLDPGAALPRRNKIGQRLARRQARQSLRDGDLVGRLAGEGWTGLFTRRAPRPRRWSHASRLVIAHADWQQAWPLLLGQIRADSLDILKRDASGDVLAGEVVLGGRPVPVVVKRPKRKTAWAALGDLFRRSRARRTWLKTWNLIVRDVPTEWPMLLMERRRLGYALDAIAVYERVPGSLLSELDLDALPADRRSTLFYRLGRILRHIDEYGFSHFDAKSTNWVVTDMVDPPGPTPVLIDLYGVRYYPWATAGVLRLLRAMKQHPQYTPQDSLHLCRGYAPTARLIRPEQEHEGEGA